MAFFDWNGNGKHDWQDDFIEHQIYEETTKESDDENTDDDDFNFLTNSTYNKPSKNLGIVGVIAVIFAIFLIVKIISAIGIDTSSYGGALFAFFAIVLGACTVACIFKEL